MFDRWIDAVRALRKSLDLGIQELARQAHRDQLSAQLKQIGVEFNAGDPAHEIGAALELARDYGITLHIGTTAHQCRAVLSREHWVRPIRAGLKSACFGSFFEDKPHDEIDAIYAFGEDVQTAVCKCVWFAFMAGVI